MTYKFSGSNDKGVFLRTIHLSSSIQAKTSDELYKDYVDSQPTTTTPKPNTTAGTTAAPTEEPPVKESGGSQTSVIVLAILVVILFLLLMALGYKYNRTAKKLNEYRVSAGRNNMPYDNPTYSGSHTPAER